MHEPDYQTFMSLINPETDKLQGRTQFECDLFCWLTCHEKLGRYPVHSIYFQIFSKDAFIDLGREPDVAQIVTDADNSETNDLDCLSSVPFANLLTFII